MGAPCFRAGFCSKTIIPDSEEHPLASSRAVPKDVLRWIRVYEACEQKNKKLVELLLANGADPNAEYDQSASWGSEHEPCLFAALKPPRASVQILRVLLEGGADPNIPRVWRENYDHEVTALSIAENSGNRELVALLKEYGAK